ncbi:multidrug resistance efflux pump [Rhodobacteraceae bacterium MBR-64]
MTDKSDIEANLARVRARLADLDAERHQLQREMEALEARLAAEHTSAVKQPSSRTPLSRIRLRRMKRLICSVACSPGDLTYFRCDGKIGRLAAQEIHLFAPTSG